MNIQHFEKGVTYSDRELRLLAKKLGRLATLCKRVKDEASTIRVEAELREARKVQDRVKVVLTISLPRALLRAESRRGTALEAIDRCIEKLEPQLARYKETHTAAGARLHWSRKQRSGGRRALFCIGLLILLSTLSPSSFAQETLDDERVKQGAEAVAAEEEKPPSITPVITGPTDIAATRTIILDASSSEVMGEDVSYRWYIGDSTVPLSRTVEAVFTPEKPGELTFRLEIRSKVEGEMISAEALHTVTVFMRKVVLIADAGVSKDKVDLHRQLAGDAGVFLRVLQPEEGALPVGAEEALTVLLTKEAQTLVGADAILLWTEGSIGLQALMRALKGQVEELATLPGKTIVLVTNRSLPILARTARGPFSVLKPQEIIVTRKEAINPLVTVASTAEFRKEIEGRDIDYIVIDESTVGLRPWNLLTALVNFMLTSGVSSQTVTLLLMLPVIATILTFLKQVVGITTFGLFAPSIVALSFIALGAWVGVFLLLAIIATGYATRAAMRRFRLLYIPKVAIILTVVSLTLLLLVGIGTIVGITLAPDTIFVLLIMSTLAESFVNLKTEEGWFSAVLAIAETILAAILCVVIVQWAPLQSLILAFPEVLLLTIVINLFLGRWTGLRLIEYIRFHEVFRHLQAEEE